MSPKNKAIELVDVYRTILMNKDTECGNEILCTVIAKKSALIAVEEVINILPPTYNDYWEQVKHEIEKI